MAAEAAKHKRDVENARIEAAARAVAGNLWGVLRDSRTGQPIPRAPMRIGDRGPIAGSDSTGHFWLWGIEPGIKHLNVYCPLTRQWLGKIATTITFVSRPAMKDTTDFRVDMTGCRDVPVDTVRIRTRGVWSIGFEDGFFTPCKPFDQIPMGGYRNFGWALLTFARSGIEPKGGWPEVAPVNGYQKIFLDVEADLIGPGSYGHMGVGTFVLRVSRVVSAAPAAAEPGGAASRQAGVDRLCGSVR
jgi:hypothetical protein